MDLRHLRSFVAVAEELHFSRAAQKLILAQSAVSAHVRDLERDIGGVLLTRTSRRVELTPAGESLLKDARAILATADDALVRARTLASGETGRLVVGCFGPAPGEILETLLDRFQADYPRVRVHVAAPLFSEVLEQLRDRRVDVSFVYLPLSEPDIHVTPLLDEPRAVIMGVTHPLADRESLRPQDVAGETFIAPPQSMPQQWRDFWVLAGEIGACPNMSPDLAPNLASSVEQWLHLLARGDRIGIAPVMLERYYSWPRITFVPLVDAPPGTVGLARMANNEDPAVAAFERVTQHVMRRMPVS